MISQKVNRHSKKLHKNRESFRSFAHASSKPVKDDQTGFIHHPSGFPLEVRRLWFERPSIEPVDESGKIGVIFQSEKYIKPGCRLEITVPLRNEEEKFRGQVVFVRHNGQNYDIGLWLKHRADASRARIVEQVCHIENYLKEKKYKEGPYAINRDRAAQEWIIKNASSVPSL